MIRKASARIPDKDASGSDFDDTVLFHAEHSFVASIAKQSLLLLLWLPFLLALPEAISIVVLSAACFALWQHRAFRFELSATHLWFRAGPFAPTLLIPLKTVREVEPVDYRGGSLAWDQLTPVGSLRLGFSDGSSITVTSVREPREVVGAVRLLRDRARAAGDNQALSTADKSAGEAIWRR